MKEEKFLAVLKEAWDSIGNGNPNSQSEIIHREFPDREERREYVRWAQAHYKALREAREPPSITGEEFIELVDTANFLNDKLVEQLVPSMQKKVRPWIPIGFDGDTLYRLVPEALGLQPHIDGDPANRAMLPPSFLGINYTVQPKEPSQPASRRQANLSESSVRTAESDDDAPGFVFFQLGELEYAENPGRQGWPSDDDEDDEDVEDLGWEPTGFNLVARLGPSGRADGIYTVFDMFPRNDYDLERRQITHAYWGIPPTPDNEQFSCAKFAHRLSDADKDYLVAWSEKIEHPVELVRVVRSGDGRPLRVTLDDHRC